MDRFPVHLLRRAREGDELARARIIRRFRDLAWSIAQDYYARGLTREDLVQEGLMGLNRAIDAFDPTRAPGGFPGFAFMAIKRGILSAVTAANRGKHAPLNESTRRLAMGATDDALEIAPLLAAPESAEPDVVLGLRQEVADAVRLVREHLTELERVSLLGVLDDRSYEDIAADLKVTTKRIDNALQRARHKLVALRDLPVAA